MPADPVGVPGLSTDPDPQVAVDGKRAADEGVRVHQQTPTRWEDDAAELRCESRLLDPGDDEHVYQGLYLQCLRLRGNAVSWVVPLDTARRLRDQLTEHLDAVQ